MLYNTFSVGLSVWYMHCRVQQKETDSNSHVWLYNSSFYLSVTILTSIIT